MECRRKGISPLLFDHTIEEGGLDNFELRIYMGRKLTLKLLVLKILIKFEVIKDDKKTSLMPLPRKK